jgi:hypothetical protein
MQEMSAMEELARDPASRRRFLTKLGGAGAAASFALFLAACGSSKKTTLTPGGSDPKTGAGTGTDRYGKGDVGIATYALVLEYIEADFYSQVIASGQLSGRVLQVVTKFGAQEALHVSTLEAVVRQLHGTLPTKPKIKVSTASPTVILQQALTFENLGAAAYLGQADRIVNKDLLAAALTIHSVEARHAAALAVAAGSDPVPQGAFAQPETAANVIDALQPILA